MEVLPTGFDNVLMGQKGRHELRGKTQERPVAPCLEGRCDILLCVCGWAGAEVSVLIFETSEPNH